MNLGTGELLTLLFLAVLIGGAAVLVRRAVAAGSAQRSGPVRRRDHPQEDDHRRQPSRTAGDRESLTAFLDFQRATLALKCQGLTADQLRRAAVPTSKLTLLGLVRHMAAIEAVWFRRTLNGEDVPSPWSEADGDYAEFLVADADADAAFALWRRECDGSRAIADRFASLDDTVEHRGEEISLRYVLTHMIEEYARHNGHADLLREAIDGTVGE
jgi:uncharacterized damage-inducible protein DinB